MTKTESIYYNYILCNPLKKGAYKVPSLDIILPCEPFYVGKGKGKRSQIHLWEVQKNLKNSDFFNKNNKHRKNTIAKIVKSGLVPFVYIVNKNLTDEVACDNEKFLINVIGRKDLGKGCLTNLTDGGETTKGFKMPKEVIERFKENRKLNPIKPMLGKNHTDESKKLVSKTKKEQYRLGLCVSKKGTKTGKKAFNALPIVVINPFTLEISHYDSIRSFLGIEWSIEIAWKFTKITTCCTGATAQYNRLIYIYKKDFTPEYLDERLQKFNSCRGKNKPIRNNNEQKKAA